ncbi:hypothetical protein [Pseudomonas sp. BGI-2]|uniref:hypothetical protein n=1 Tax=Pseudomonas sp. BGI-2 TaxID=2528211 RepID=UPI0010342599|nr:hypothetical protein [Pseudomonas sp. BGI-2]TBN42122.1 hypothetical protein EYC95_18255 [Pseudomonas sp. BGI-2]
MDSITAVTNPANPKILEAHGSAGDRLDFDSVYHRDFITAQVPHYSGMARGHTVTVTWGNPRHIYNSEVVTVGTPGAIDIRIPRIEVIDAIGHTVKVYYTVRTAPGTALIPSRILLLHINPYEFNLLAPTLSTDQKTLSVRYVGMVHGYTVRIRATGKTTWESDEREVQTGVTPTFTLPSNWIAENRGIDTRINYSVYKSGSGQRLMFSKVLRVRIGEQVLPAPLINISSGGLAGQALPHDWPHTRATNSATITGEPNRQVNAKLSGNARFSNASNEIDMRLDSQGRSIQPVSNALAQTVDLTATYGTGPSIRASMIFSASFPADAALGSTGVRANVSSGAAANGISPNRVTYDTFAINQPMTLRAQVSGSARLPAYSAQIANIRLYQPSWDCTFDVVNTVRETVTVTFEILELGSWTRFSKQMTFV